MFDKKILKILACPQCKSSLKYKKNTKKLICKKCQVYYPVKDSIPHLLIDSAKPLKKDQKSQ